jgi:hypothetical protein|uniref:DUF5899 domain-containing protein n=1 Tax=viral metagenome TaxID=1070528 RepID=A0A6C0IQM6_9ZZZZ
MELAIPGIALGLLYVASNQNKKNEGFSDYNGLPNTNIPDKNYPDEKVNFSELDNTATLTTLNKYDAANGAYTDKYFQQNMDSTKNTKTTNEPSFMSLAGDKVSTNYFEHDNMVPYFGSNSMADAKNANSNEGVLDNYIGSGSQNIEKKEQSPLFAPSDNQQYSYGAPNASDFYQSRVNPSAKMSNVNPFQEEMVGPGLGLGYTNDGADGFNSGMMSRETWLPKNVDDLRVENNPKSGGNLIYGYEGAANSRIKNVTDRDHMGVMEKHRPEKTFELGHDRVMTTTGLEKGQTLRPITVDKFVNRPETTASYVGAAGYANENGYVPGEFMESKKTQLGNVPIGIANANGRQYANTNDYGAKSKMAYPNNRSSNKQDSYFGLVSGSLGAAVAPLLDVLRPSRKENVVGTLRPYQNAGSNVPQSYIFNPNDKVGVTHRETTENSKFHLNVNRNQNGMGYMTNENQAYDTNRQETGDYFYAGNAAAGAGTRESTSYAAGYNQRNNDVKSSTINGRLVPGNMKLKNNDLNIRQKDKNAFLKNDRAISGGMPSQIPEAGNMGRMSGTENALYSNIQMDRTNTDVTDMLKSNPYVTNYKNAL